MRIFAIYVLLILGVPAAAVAADPRVEVVGAVQKPGAIAFHDLPAQTVAVDQATSGPKFQGSFSGPALWDVLAKAGVVDPGRGGLLQRTVTITARDGYAVVMSYAEINPDYGGNGAILAVGEHSFDCPARPKSRTGGQRRRENRSPVSRANGLCGGAFPTARRSSRAGRPYFRSRLRVARSGPRGRAATPLPHGARPRARRQSA